MELRDFDENEAAEPVETSTTETEKQIEESELAKEPAEESTEAPVNVQKEEQEQPKVPVQPKHSRAEERIRNLAKENRELQEKLKNFGNQVAPELQREEIAYDDLNKVINERAMQAAELMIASQNVGTQVQNQATKWAEDFDKVKQDNPQLDPTSPNYDFELDSTLAKLLDDGNGMPRTDILVSDVISTFKKRETATQTKAIEAGKSQANATLARQMAEGAITPTAKKSSNNDEELSDEDSEALRTSNPKEWLKRL